MTEPVLARLQHLMSIREGVENLSRTPEWPASWQPAADWADEGTHLLLLLDVPGVATEALNLSEDTQRVTISGERPGVAHLLSSQRPSGPFSLTLDFPEEVLPQSGQASLVSGVLQVRFEKKHPTIDVSSRDATQDAQSADAQSANIQ